jgi:capsid protein
LEAFLAARWIRPAWGWVDPVKEIESSTLAVKGNLSTPQAEAARSGMDLEEIYESRADAWVLAREIEQRKGLPEGALEAVGATPQPAQPQPAQPQDQPEEPVAQ